MSTDFGYVIYGMTLAAGILTLSGNLCILAVAAAVLHTLIEEIG